MNPEEVIAGVRAGTRRAIGRAISMAESLGPDGRAVMAALHPVTGRAMRIGITGSPGAGKSTLAAALVRHLRHIGMTVAIVSVDPTSPFTHGAVLGDRIRLVDHFLDDGVFIRSMATRGHLGGLSEATGDAVEILDAAGFDVVIIETVGSGQNEIEVQALAETVVLVLIPGSGDAIQAIKAGVMEIPDVIVINKADRPGADILAGEIETALSLVPSDDWRPPVLMTQAIDGNGIAEMWEGIESHRAALAEGDALADRRRDGMRRRLRALAMERMAREMDARIDEAALDSLVTRVVARELDPSAAADTMAPGRTHEQRRSKVALTGRRRHESEDDRGDCGRGAVCVVHHRQLAGGRCDLVGVRHPDQPHRGHPAVGAPWCRHHVLPDAPPQPPRPAVAPPGPIGPPRERRRLMRWR